MKMVAKANAALVRRLAFVGIYLSGKLRRGGIRKSDGGRSIGSYILPLVPYIVENRYEAVMTVWRELSYLYKKP
ncbi:hypothetical protein [Peribacillus frigoritolerans]|uniref:hypothetical protein n=1 Tax=Peribacillus frigoritolerans TaxID=450367 RepID=UPI0020C10DDF|nr:hypothetical protein [Peribacillus frigoritolerans]